MTGKAKQTKQVENLLLFASISFNYNTNTLMLIDEIFVEKTNELSKVNVVVSSNISMLNSYPSSFIFPLLQINSRRNNKTRLVDSPKKNYLNRMKDERIIDITYVNCVRLLLKQTCREERSVLIFSLAFHSIDMILAEEIGYNNFFYPK